MRLYFDENFSPSLIQGLKVIQDGRKSDDIDVCSVEGEFGRGAKDEDWIPSVAGKHGIILTQDTNIHRTRAQWELCRTSKVGVFFFRPPKKGWSYWQIVQLLVRWWPELCARAKDTRKPFGFCIEFDGRKMKPL
jgi:hypothetical protein